MVENSNQNKKNWILRIILIIIIVLLLFKNCSLLKKVEKQQRKVNGNIDIFNIECKNTSCSDKKNTIKENGFFVKDSDIVWNETNRLRIFENPYYEMREKIAPESSNSYHFMVTNSTNYKIHYQLNFLEENPYHIHMKYKLRQGGVYVAGSPTKWVSYDEMNDLEVELGSELTYNYILDWKWESGENDLEAADKKDAYLLKINVQAEFIDE